MKNRQKVLVLSAILFLVLHSGAMAQALKTSETTVNKTRSNKPWSAFWIALPDDPGKEYGVYYFRKSLELPQKPENFIVKVSADNRYKLYVNGSLVSVGPARVDIYYWNYETIDLSPYLTTGKNTITAIVWNDGEVRPEAQISLRTVYILQGNSKIEEVLNTNRSWKCFQDKAYSPLTEIGYREWYIADAGETVDMNRTVTNWMAADFDDSSWLAAKMIDQGKPKGVPDASGWMLVDQTYLTTAYLTLNFSGGSGSSISIGYAETLFDDLKKSGTQKINRDEVEGKDFAGRRDSLISNGSPGQAFNTRYWRTFRYIKLRVQTKDAPLVIDDIYGTFTGYPFSLNASLQTDNAEMQKILDIGWRTARLNALETYMELTAMLLGSKK